MACNFKVHVNSSIEIHENGNDFISFIHSSTNLENKQTMITSLISLLAPLYWVISVKTSRPLLKIASSWANTSWSDSVGCASASTSETHHLTVLCRKSRWTYSQNPKTSRIFARRSTLPHRGRVIAADFPLFRSQLMLYRENMHVITGLLRRNLTDVRLQPSPDVKLACASSLRRFPVLPNWLDIIKAVGGESTEKLQIEV